MLYRFFSAFFKKTELLDQYSDLLHTAGALLKDSITIVTIAVVKTESKSQWARDAWQLSYFHWIKARIGRLNFLVQKSGTNCDSVIIKRLFD